MAETSGFATDLPQSAYLAHTIRRAISAAEQRSHRYVTLEHLLLALLDDPDALALMQVARTDVSALRSAVTETINHGLATLYTPGAFDLHPSYKVERVLQSSSDDARRMGRSEVDGAFVVVALFHETDSPAYDLLKRHNFVFHAAITWIDRNRAAPKPKYAPPPAPVVETLREPEPVREAEPEPRAPVPAPTADDHFDETDAEILLDEVVDDEDGFGQPMPSGKPALPIGLPPFLRQRIEDAEPQTETAPARPVMRADVDAPVPHPALPPRSRPPRPAQEAASDLGSAVPARELSAPHDHETGMAPMRPSRDPGDNGGPEQRAAERRPPPDPRFEGARPEPRLAPPEHTGEMAARHTRRGARRSAPAAKAEVARAEPRFSTADDTGEMAGRDAQASQGRPAPVAASEAPNAEPRFPPSTGIGAMAGRDAPATERRSASGGRSEAAREEPRLSAPTGPAEITEQDWQAAERRAGPGPHLEGARAEPRLPTSADRGRGLGAATPGRGEPDFADAPEFRQRFEPHGPAPGQDLGSAVPGRDDVPAAVRPADPAESRPSRHHATARERSTPAPRQPAPSENEAASQPAGAQRGGGNAERREPPRPPAPAPAAPRPEPELPGAHRLDDMRVRPASAPQAPPAPPQQRPGGKKTAAREKESDKARTRRRPSPAAVYTGKLAENIPRKMRAFKTERIEVRITREETGSFLSGFEGSMEAFRHDLLVTQAMSVMLRAPDGGFTVENLGPETQWIFNRPGPAEKEPFGRWRWAVTPTQTGSRRLQLIVAARSVDQNGLAGDTALPDQVITVNVRANYGRSIVQALKWMVLMALGGVITEGVLQLMRLLGKN